MSFLLKWLLWILFEALKIHTKCIFFVGYRKKNWSDRESPGIASLAARAGVSSPLYSPLPVRDCCLVTRASLSKGESPPNSWFFIRDGFQGGDSLLLWNGEFMRTSTYVKPTLYFLLVVNSCVMQMWFSIVYKLLCLSSCIWNIYIKKRTTCFTYLLKCIYCLVLDSESCPLIWIPPSHTRKKRNNLFLALYFIKNWFLQFYALTFKNLLSVYPSVCYI